MTPNPHAEGDMKPSERDFEKAKKIRETSHINNWPLAVEMTEVSAFMQDKFVAQALSAERASLPESVIIAMSKYSMFSGNQEMRKALSELLTWQKGEL